MCLPLLLAASGGGKEDQPWRGLDDPVQVFVPPGVADTWSRAIEAQALAASPCAGLAIRMPSDAPRGARVDLFSWADRRWKWRATLRSENPVGCVPAGVEPPAAVLVRGGRPEGRYGWAESTGRKSELQVRWYKNLLISGEPSADPIYLYSAGEAIPRTVEPTTARVRHLPVEPAMACRIGPAAACSVIPGNETTLTLPGRGKADGALRIFLGPKDRYRLSVYSPGRSVVLPRTTTTETVVAGGWVAVALSGQDWENVVIDWEFEDAATQRVEGKDLPRPPAYHPLETSAERGIAVRPRIRGRSELATETEARLLVLPDAEGVSGRIPLASLSADPEGVFRAPNLPPGRYRLKLLASLSRGEPAAADLRVHQVEEVWFDSGPTVFGRLRLRRASTGDSPPEVQVVRRGVALDASLLQDEDLADSLIVAPVSPEGKFRFALFQPGEFALRAIWGRARAERAFMLAPGVKELDLGDIVLDSELSLSGVVRDCATGQLIMVPMPDLSRPIELRFFEVRRVALGQDGQFFVEGLVEGMWGLSARCGGQRKEVRPEMIRIAPGSDSFVELSAFAESSPEEVR